ncbi:MAG: hypothetical protein IJC67_05885 [Clostridia bacterium]|nr:hypothetical protein [Clostridia bacterium]
MRRRRSSLSRTKRGSKYIHGSDPLRTVRRSMGVGSVPHKKWRARKRVRTGRILLALVLLLALAAAAVFVLRPMYIRTQQNKVTMKLLNGEQVFVEPDALAQEKEEQKQFPLYAEKEYAERQTVGLTPLGTLTFAEDGAALPVVQGRDAVYLRYAIGCDGLPEEGMITLYGRGYDPGSRMCGIDSLAEGNKVSLKTANGEAAYTVTAREMIENSALSAKIKETEAKGETELLLVTVAEEEGNLLLIHAVLSETYEEKLAVESAPAPTPTATPVPTPEPTPTAEPTPSPSPTPTPKATRKPSSSRRTPTPAPVEETPAEPTPKPSSGFDGAFVPEQNIDKKPEQEAPKQEDTGAFSDSTQDFGGAFGNDGGQS